MPGAEGLLAAGIAAPSRDRSTRRAEASLQRAIEAVQALRGWRDVAGVKAGARSPRGSPPTATSETAAHLARLARLSLSADADGAEPVASVAVPGGAVEILAGDGLDLGERPRKSHGTRARSSRPRSSAPRASSPTRASSPRRRRTWSRPSARSSQRLRAELEAL